LIFVDFSRRINLEKSKFDKKSYYASCLIYELLNVLKYGKRAAFGGARASILKWALLL